MKKHIRKIASIMLSATLGAAMVSQMPLTASAASYTYEDQYSKISYNLVTDEGETRAEITSVVSKNYTLSSGNVFIYIPDTLQNYPVILGSYAFSSMNTKFEVTCSPKKIKAYAFYKCNGLEEFYVSQNCESVESYAFYNCDYLKRAIFTGYGFQTEDDSKLEIKTKAYYSCDRLNYIAFGCRDDIIINRRAFYGSYNLTSMSNDNASFDHCSMYVQEGAFEGTGLVGTNKSIVPASSVASRYGWYDRGKAGQMVGDVLIVNLLVNTPDTPAFEYSPSYGVNYGAGYNSWLLEQEAAKYGVDLDINNQSVHVSTSLNVNSICNTSTFTSRAEVLSALKKQYAFLSGCSSISAAEDALMDHFGCNQIAFIVNLNCDGRSFAWVTKESAEYAVVFYRGTVSYNNGHVWLHEVCHLFGAHDVYEEVASNDWYVGRYMNKDLMYHNEVNIGWFTACTLGWTDTAMKSDADAVWGTNNASGAAVNRVYAPLQ